VAAVSVRRNGAYDARDQYKRRAQWGAPAFTGRPGHHGVGDSGYRRRRRQRDSDTVTGCDKRVAGIAHSRVVPTAKFDTEPKKKRNDASSWLFFVHRTSRF
jgi:hypothetical protein